MLRVVRVCAVMYVRTCYIYIYTHIHMYIRYTRKPIFTCKPIKNTVNTSRRNYRVPHWYNAAARWLVQMNHVRSPRHQLLARQKWNVESWNCRKIDWGIVCRFEPVTNAMTLHLSIPYCNVLIALHMWPWSDPMMDETPMDPPESCNGTSKGGASMLTNTFPKDSS